MRQDVIKFINHFSKFGQDVVDCFSDGNCYWFAHILAQRFHGCIVYNPLLNHFACQIGELEVYDITGLIDTLPNPEDGWMEEKNWYSWKYYHNEDSAHARRIRRDCINLTT